MKIDTDSEEPRRSIADSILTVGELNTPGLTKSINCKYYKQNRTKSGGKPKVNWGKTRGKPGKNWGKRWKNRGKRSQKHFFFKNCRFCILFSFCSGAKRDVPLSLCPRTKKFPCPAVPLSRDKKVLPVPLSLCPGTMKGLLSRCPAGQENTVSLETLV